ncbi:MAG: transposase, partial [Bacteroidota bacterium]|nr:transposase [Bacteroidota bacterium]
GKNAKKYLIEIPQRFDYAKLDEFVVMPNHIHAIIVIDKNNDGGGDDGDGDGKDAINRVSTPNPPKRGGITGNKNPMLHNNISRIFNWYTGRVTFESRKINKNYGWQSLFYDHIIRNDKSYQRIQNYIINNPLNWNEDKFYNE